MIVAFALLLRLPLLNGSFWLDEAAQALESSRPFSQQLQIRDDFQPPLIHLLVHFLLQFTRNEALLRTGAALIPALITIYVMMQIAKKHFCKSCGWLSGLLLATSSFHIFFSQELRPYSLPAMFALLSWQTVLAVTNKGKASPHTGIIIGFKELTLWVLWNALGLYSSYLYPFVFLGQIVFLLWSWRTSFKKIASMIIASAVVSLSFLPWLPSFMSQLSAGQQLRKSFPGWQEVVSFDQFKSLTLTFGKFLFGVLDLSINPFFIFISVTIVGSLIALAFMVRKNKNLLRLVPLWICWVVIPIGTAWFVSFFIPVLQPKRVLFALPAFYLLFSVLIAEGLKRGAMARILAFVLLGSMLIVNIFGTFAYYTDTKLQRENWRELQRSISQKYSPGNSIVFLAFNDQFASWKWYNQDSFPTAVSGVFVIGDDPSSLGRTQLKNITDYNFILVFEYLTPLTDPKHWIENDLQRYGFEQVDVIRGNGQLGNVKVFARTRQIIGYSEY